MSVFLTTIISFAFPKSSPTLMLWFLLKVVSAGFLRKVSAVNMRRCTLVLKAAPVLLNPLPPKNRGLYRVPQNQKWVLERYGAFWGVLDAGPHFVTPLIDDVRFAVSTAEVSLPILVRDCMTVDGLLVDLEIDVSVRVSDGVEDIKRLCYGSADTPSVFLGLASTRIAKAVRSFSFEELSGASFIVEASRALASPLTPGAFNEADPTLWDGVKPAPTASTPSDDATAKKPSTEAGATSQESNTASATAAASATDNESDAKKEGPSANETTTGESSKATSAAAGHKEENNKGGSFITQQTGLVVMGLQLRQVILTPEARYQLSVRAHEQHVQDAARFHAEQDGVWREAAAKHQRQTDEQRAATLSTRIAEDAEVQRKWAESTAEAIRVLSAAIRAERERDGIKQTTVDSAQLAVQLLTTSSPK